MKLRMVEVISTKKELIGSYSVRIMPTGTI